jgi:hypothetical protein
MHSGDMNAAQQMLQPITYENCIRCKKLRPVCCDSLRVRKLSSSATYLYKSTLGGVFCADCCTCLCHKPRIEQLSMKL